MDTPELKQIWKNKYQIVPSQLEKIKQIKKRKARLKR